MANDIDLNLDQTATDAANKGFDQSARHNEARYNYYIKDEIYKT